jgi:hypothetical protein
MLLEVRYSLLFGKSQPTSQGAENKEKKSNGKIGKLTEPFGVCFRQSWHDEVE